jgi:ABC-type transporter Mla subunit MlaD
MNDHLRRALEALEAGAADARHLSSRSTEGVRERLKATVEEVLDHLEREIEEPEDVMGRLDRQSRDIADDLRRAERLMKQRLGRE